MEQLFKAELYSHGVRITGYRRETLQKLSYFLESLSLKEPKKDHFGRVTMELKKRYYGITADYRELFIHARHWPEMVKYLEDRGIGPEQYTETFIPAPKPADATFVLKPFYELYEYQEVIVDELSDENPSRRLDLQTGKGKTLSALAALARMAIRGGAMVYPKYEGIWTKALKETYEDIEGRYVEVSGTDDLKRLIHRGLAGDLPWDFYIISAPTYRAFLNAYEEHGLDMLEMGWGCTPYEFHAATGIGFQINDEFQDDPALTFRIDIFTNIRKQVYLSATPFTGNPFVTRMINVMLPESTRCTLPSYDAYAEVINLIYTDPLVKPKDYLTPFKNTYNHDRYEKKLMEHKGRKAKYYDMVKRIVQKVYVDDRIQGQKMLILCGRVLFIHDLTAYLKKEFPFLKIGHHVQGGDPKLLQVNDITVSTIKSSGTGQDILDLREVLLLKATGSERDAEQIKGRLRKLRNFPEATPRLTYLTCLQIPQHSRYHHSRVVDFEGKCKSHRTMRIA